LLFSSLPSGFDFDRLPISSGVPPWAPPLQMKEALNCKRGAHGGTTLQMRLPTILFHADNATQSLQRFLQFRTRLYAQGRVSFDSNNRVAINLSFDCNVRFTRVRT